MEPPAISGRMLARSVRSSIRARVTTGEVATKWTLPNPDLTSGPVHNREGTVHSVMDTTGDKAVARDPRALLTVARAGHELYGSR